MIIYVYLDGKAALSFTFSWLRPRQFIGKFRNTSTFVRLSRPLDRFQNQDVGFGRKNWRMARIVLELLHEKQRLVRNTKLKT